MCRWLQDKWFALDTSGNGLLDFNETKVMLRGIKKKMTESEIEAAFKEMDKDGCGNVDFDEFYLWFAHQDAEQFAHLMSHSAHRDFVRGAVVVAIFMAIPLLLIVLVSGPNPVVSSRFLALALPPMDPKVATLTQLHTVAAVGGSHVGCVAG